MMWDDYLGDWIGGGDADFGDIFDYDFTMGGGDPTFFGDFTTGDTSWIDDFDWSSALDTLDFSGLNLPSFNLGSFTGDTYWDDYTGEFVRPTFDFGQGPVDISDVFSAGYEGIRPSFDPTGNLIFETPEGQITYMPGGTIQTEWDEGGTQFYTSNDGRDYFIDYRDPRYMDLVEVFGQETGGVGPTRYTAYSGAGDEAKVVDYSDVFSPTGGRITTTSDGRTVIYEDGRAMVPGAGAGGAGSGKSTLERIIDRFVKGGEGGGGGGAGGGKSGIDPLLAALLGGLLGLLNKPESKGPVGYQGGIPKYTATRGQAQAPTTGGRVPGGAGIPSLTGGVTYTKAAQGGLMGLASGGKPNPPRYLRGGTDGMGDEIYTDIDGKQPARLSHGEFVVPADVVSHLGNGNSDAGAKELHKMMDRVRQVRTGTKKQGKEINPRKHLPA